MDTDRKKQLLWEYKNRRPQMGIICFYSRPANEAFLSISKDTNADLNSNRFKLKSGNHPNKELQQLWKQQGEQAFECSVVEILEYKDKDKDYTDKLEALLEKSRAKYENPRRLWR